MYMSSGNEIKSFGDMIRILRKEKDVSLYDIQRDVGISPSYISRLEKGGRDNPSMEYVSKLAGYFNIPITVIQDLFPGSFNDNTTSELDSLDEIMLKSEFIFANIRANIDIKLSLQKVVKLLENYIMVENVTRNHEANLLQEIDKLKGKIKSA